MFRALNIALCLIGIASQSFLSAAETWRFGIMGDTHDSPPKHKDSAGVALDYIDAVNKEFIKHKVDFVVQCGDLADAEGGQDPKGFETRFKAAEPLRKAGIPFYALRGNHDTGVMRQKQMEEFFIPGAQKTPIPTGFVKKGLDYGFRHKNASLYFLDIYNSLHPDKLVEWSKWMSSFRSNPKRPPFCIVFTHRTLHVPLSFRENLFGEPNDVAPEDQNEFYRDLSAAGVNFFVTAHLHVHIRAKVKSPNGKYAIDTLVCAPCGDKVFPIDAPIMMEKRDKIGQFHSLCVGYYIVTVSDEGLKIDFYAVPSNGHSDFGSEGSEFKLKDSWQIAAPSIAADGIDGKKGNERK